MERFNINYLKKTSPFLRKKNTKYNLLLKCKTLEFLGTLSSNEKETFGFKLYKCRPSVEELAEFESDLLTMVHNIEFRAVRNNFLSKLKDNVKVINNTKEVLVNVDRSTNTYKMNKNAYNKHLTDR